MLHLRRDAVHLRACAVSDELKVMWELTKCDQSDHKILTHLLANGWEPFAVTLAPEGMKASNYDGTIVYYNHIVWLKRLKTA